MNQAWDILYERVKDKSLLSEDFQNMLTAFMSLIEEIAEGKVSNMEWGDHMIYLKNSSRLLFIACCPPMEKKKKVDATLDKVIEHFFSSYSQLLIDQYRGDKNVFENAEKQFNEYLDRYMKE